MNICLNIFMAITNINANEFKEMLEDEAGSIEVVDVREPDEYTLIKVKGSNNIPMSVIPLKINDINWNKKVVLLCKSGARSSHIAKLLASTGKNVLNLVGGIYALNQMNCPRLEKSSNCCQGYL